MLDTKKFKEAIIVLNGMLLGSPHNSNIHHLLGTALSAAGEYNKAIVHYRKVQPGTRFFKEAVIQNAYLYQEIDQIRKGIDFLNEVIRKEPNNTEFLFYLGILYEDAEEYDKAETTFLRGLEIDPENVKYHFRLGIVYDKNSKKEACIEEMKTVIRIDPKHASALNYLGYTYADAGENLEAAETMIKEALRQKPDDGYITDSLGWVYYKKGLFEKAVEYLERAVKLVPDDPVILEHLGDAYRKMNQRQKALEFYRRSLLNKNEKKEALEKKIKELTEGVKEQ